MGTRWRPDFDPNHLYFISTTAVDHLHLFQRDVVKRLLLDTLDCMRLRKFFTLYVFAMIPNHIHVIIQCPEEKPVKDAIRDFKKHTADRLIRHYHAEDNQQALKRLTEHAQNTEKQHYNVWEEGYNAKSVVSVEFLRQKIEYIHNNPCQPQWRLADDPKKYIWSSAQFYLTDQPCIIPVSDVRKLMV